MNSSSDFLLNCWFMGKFESIGMSFTWECYMGTWLFIVWRGKYHDFKNNKYLYLYILGKGTMGNGTFQNVSGETGHFYYMGNGTFSALLVGTLYSLGNGKFYTLRRIFSSGNRTNYPLEIDPLIPWVSGHPLGKGTWEIGHAIPWDWDHLSSGKHPLGIGNLGDEVQPFSRVFLMRSNLKLNNIYRSWGMQ